MPMDWPGAAQFPVAEVYSACGETRHWRSCKKSASSAAALPFLCQGGQGREDEMHLKGLAIALVALAAGATSAVAQVKVGVLSDMSSLYADITGEGSIAAARMAAEDFGPV